MDVYVDLIMLENIVINFFILFITAKVSKAYTTTLRMLMGALLGALYVIVLLIFPEVTLYYSIAGKIILSFFIILTAFKIDRIVSFFKILLIFYFSTFLFAGAAFFLLYINQSGGFVADGIFYVYWKTDYMLIIMSAILVLIVFRVIWDLLKYKLVEDKLLVPLKVVFDSKIIDTWALIDTGNSLYDPITMTPVVVVEFSALKDILPKEIQDVFTSAKENDLPNISQIDSTKAGKWISRLRLIPFSSLGRENGMLIGFRPDYIEVGDRNESRGIKDVVVGIYNRTLSRNRKYNALLNPELV